jgi:hypothetical protein
MKIAAEKYIFDRAETVLRAMYLHRDRPTSELFQQKKQKIISNLTTQQIYTEVLLNNSLASIPCANPLVRGGVEFCVVACPELEKAALASSPREKMKHCQLMYAQLKFYFDQKLTAKYCKDVLTQSCTVWRT